MLLRLLFLFLLFHSLHCSKEPSNRHEGNVVVYSRSSGRYSDHQGYGIYTNSDSGNTESPVIESKTVAFDFPNWGKDGRIYFLSKYQGESFNQIYSVQLNGKDIKRLSQDLTAEYTELDVSPLTGRLLYKKIRNNTVELCSNGPEGTEEKVLFATESAKYYSWHPAANEIIFNDWVVNSDGSRVRNIYKMKEDGSQKTRMTANTDTTANYYIPYLSPDGKKLVYISNRKVSFGTSRYDLSNVYISNSDGSEEIKLTNNMPQTHGVINTNWSKDSKRVLIIEYETRRPYSLYQQDYSNNYRKDITTSWHDINAKMKQH